MGVSSALLLSYYNFEGTIKFDLKMTLHFKR